MVLGQYIFAHSLQGRIQKTQKGVTGTLNSSILDTFYFSETELYKNNPKF